MQAWPCRVGHLTSYQLGADAEEAARAAADEWSRWFDRGVHEVSVVVTQRDGTETTRVVRR